MGVESGAELARSQQVSSNTSTSTASCREAPLALSSSVTSLSSSSAPSPSSSPPPPLAAGQVAAGSAHANYFGHNVLILFAFDYFCNFIASIGLPPLSRSLYASGLLPAALWASTAAVRGSKLALACPGLLCSCVGSEVVRVRDMCSKVQ